MKAINDPSLDRSPIAAAAALFPAEPRMPRWLLCNHAPSRNAYVHALDETADYSKFQLDLPAGRYFYTIKYAAIVRALAQNGLELASERLQSLLEEQEESSEEALLQISSLRNLALFLISEPSLETSRIGIAPDGMAQIEWRTKGRGIIVMKFLPDGTIEFAGIGPAVARGDSRKRVSGTLRHAEAMAALGSFFEELT